MRDDVVQPAHPIACGRAPYRTVTAPVMAYHPGDVPLLIVEQSSGFVELTSADLGDLIAFARSKGMA